MEVLSTVVNAVVVGTVGLILAWLGKGKLEAQDRRVDRLEERLEHRIDGLQQRMDTLQVSLDGVRSDLTQVALAVGVRRTATS
jgi:hypothetical protein